MLEFMPLLDKNSDIPIYIQLYQYTREKIESGDIPENSYLPSVRSLCNHLNISKNTVESAFQQLIAEGYVLSKPRVGLIVLPIEEKITLPSTLPECKSKSIESETDSIKFDFKYGEIDLNSFPFTIWKRCLNQALNIYPEQVINHGIEKGDIGLRQEISEYLFNSRGVNCSLEQIVICAGTHHALSVIIQLLSSNENEIAVEDPSYLGVQSVFENCGWSLDPISLEYDGINIKELNKTKAKVVYVTPSHQFPYGMVLPIQKRNLLLEWAYKNNRFIIEDDYDSEFRYQTQPIPALKAIDNQDNVIYMGTFSKSFSPAVRVSYIVLPKKLLNMYDDKVRDSNLSVSPIIQKGLYLFMREGYYNSHIRKMRKIYQRKQKILVDSLNKHMGKHIEIIGDKAGLHLLLKVNDIPTEDLINKAKEVGVRVYGTTKYCIKKENNQSLIILGYGGMTEEEIKKGVILLERAWFSKYTNKK